MQLANETLNPALDEVIATKVLAALGDEIAVRLLEAHAEEVRVEVTGSFTGTLQLQVSKDGTNYSPAPLTPVGGGTVVVNITAAGTWYIQGLRGAAMRAKATAWTSGSATVNLHRISARP